MLSISRGCFQDKSSKSIIQDILGKIRFPVIYVPTEIIEIMYELKSEREIKFYSPRYVSQFLRNKYKGNLVYDEKLNLANYLSLLIDDDNYERLRNDSIGQWKIQ
ncbi:hypothetical protein F8M41_003990 [Gigaspora margarita]|uniref:Uncharacterized protein n=1 Tax=Gigaspora margarita TaxID=4874 RepID=A0A8H3XBW8_GIGMA|nr:hypothetical protein F8M41_003990 [Gigaspora margarita]